MVEEKWEESEIVTAIIIIIIIIIISSYPRYVLPPVNMTCPWNNFTLLNADISGSVLLVGDYINPALHRDASATEHS